MSLDAVPVMPPGILAHLLDRVGAAGNLSPRARLGESVAPNDRQMVELAVHAVTRRFDDDTPTDAFTAIAEQLLDPTTVVDLRIWEGYSSAWSSFVFDGTRGVTMTEIPGGVLVSGPVGPSSIADAVLPLLAAVEPDDDPGLTLELHLDAATVAAAAAVVDAARAAAEHDAPVDHLPISAVLDHADAGFSDMEASSLRLQSRIMSRQPTAPSRTEVGDALRRLADQDLIELDTSTVTLRPLLRGIGLLLPMGATGFRWQRRTSHAEVGLSTTDRILNVGLHGLILEVSMGAQGYVTWRTLRVKDAVDDLGRELALAAHAA